MSRLSRPAGLGAALLLGATLLLAGCGEKPELSPLSPDDIVLAFGDSITYGTGAKPGQSYPEVLASLIDRTVVGSGVPGEVTHRGLERLGNVLSDVRPKLVILCHGGNDILRRLPVSQAGANLRAMIRLIRERGAEVMLIGVPKFGLLLDTAPVYEEVAEELDVPIETEILPSILSDNDLKADTVHPNAAGYARLAEAIQVILKERGAL